MNSPYEKPELHYHTNEKGELDYEGIQEGRRIFVPDINVIPTRQGAQKSVFEVNDFAEEYGQHLVNLIRKEIKNWRNSAYPNTTRVSKELLDFWFNNPDRHAIKKLFFAQRESIETAIWLNEVADRSNAGQNILNKINTAQKAVSPEVHLSSSQKALPLISRKLSQKLLTFKKEVLCEKAILRKHSVFRS